MHPCKNFASEGKYIKKIVNTWMTGLTFKDPDGTSFALVIAWGISVINSISNTKQLSEMQNP